MMASLICVICTYRWNPDSIVFSSNQVYGTPSYWVQHMFRESNGATFLKSQLQTADPNSVAASAILWQNPQDKKTYLKIKVINACILLPLVICQFVVLKIYICTN